MKSLNWNKILFWLGFLHFFQRVVWLFVTAEPYDLVINIDGVQAWRGGSALYGADPAKPIFTTFISSPIVAVLHWPMIHLSLIESVLIFRLLSLVVYLFALILLYRVLPVQRTSGLFWLIALSWEPVFDSVGLGQLNEIIVLCLIIGYWGWIHKHAWAAGIGVGLAAALKINPVLLVGYWLWRREWRPACIALGIAAVCGIASCFFVSWGECRTFALSILPDIGRGSADFYNQSLSGFLARSWVDSLKDWTDLEILPASTAFRVLSWVVSVVLVLGVLAMSQFHIQHDCLIIRALEFDIALVTLLLISPISWQHYSVWVVIVVPPVLIILSRPQCPQRYRLWALASFGLIMIRPYHLLPIALDIARHFSVLLGNVLMSAGLWGLLLLLALLIKLRRLDLNGELLA